MSTTDYDRLYSNVYTKTEVDTLVGNNSGGIVRDNVLLKPSDDDYKLGDHVTEQQWTNIANGSFKNLLIGQYWTINNVNYRIVGRNTYYGYYNLNKNHLVIWPDTVYSNQPFQTTNTNSGIYYTSNLRNYVDNTYVPYIISIFGENHILGHTRSLPSYGGSSGSGVTSANVKAWIPGSPTGVIGSYYEYGINAYDELAFPAQNYGLITPRANFWVACHVGATSDKYYYVETWSRNSYGEVTYTKTAALATTSHGVRPAFLIY